MWRTLCIRQRTIWLDLEAIILYSTLIALQLLIKYELQKYTIPYLKNSIHPKKKYKFIDPTVDRTQDLSLMNTNEGVTYKPVTGSAVV